MTYAETITLLCSVVALVFSYLAFRSNRETVDKADDANLISNKALTYSQDHFIESNRPFISIFPILSINQIDQYSLSIHTLMVDINDNKSITFRLLLFLENKGNILAKNVNIDESTIILFYSGKRIGSVTYHYDNLGNIFESKEDIKTKGNFTLISMPPNSSIVKEYAFTITPSENYSIDEIQKNISKLVLNLYLHLSYSYQLLKNKRLTTHTSHAITPNGTLVLEQRFEVIDTEHNKLL